MYVTTADTEVTVYGMTVTVFGRSADRAVKVGRNRFYEVCDTQGCTQRAHAFVERTFVVNVNEGKGTWERGARIPAPYVGGFRHVKWDACAFHFISTLDHAYTVA